MARLLGEKNYDVLERIKKTKKRLILFDYDIISNEKKEAEFNQVIKELKSKFQVGIFTERKSEDIDKVFEDKDLLIYSENGLYKRNGTVWRILEESNQELKDKVKNNLNSLKGQFEDAKTNGEEHTQPPKTENKTDNDDGFLEKAGDAVMTLWKETKVGAIKGINSIDSKLKSSNKSSIIDDIKEFDLSILIGGGESDEDMLSRCSSSENMISISIGDEKSKADYYIKDLDKIFKFFKGIE